MLDGDVEQAEGAEEDDEYPAAVIVSRTGRPGGERTAEPMIAPTSVAMRPRPEQPEDEKANRPRPRR